jgi:hypothetical protein
MPVEIADFESNSSSRTDEEIRWGEIHRQLQDSSKLKDCHVCGRSRFRPLGDEANAWPSTLLSAANSGCQSCLVVCLALEHFNMLWESSKYARIKLPPFQTSVRLMIGEAEWKELDFYIRPRDKLSLTGSYPF